LLVAGAIVVYTPGQRMLSATPLPVAPPRRPATAEPPKPASFLRVAAAALAGGAVVAVVLALTAVLPGPRYRLVEREPHGWELARVRGGRRHRS
jgi:hypothetical protein